MNLREKIGQMIVMPLNVEFTNTGSEKFALMRREIEQNKVGGFTLFRGEANSISVLTNEAQRIAKIPLFFFSRLRTRIADATPHRNTFHNQYGRGSKRRCRGGFSARQNYL